MGRSSRAHLALAAAIGVALAAPAAAQGNVNIGSNLGRTPDIGHSCSPPCTLVPASLSPEAAVPGGLVSPVNGTVVTWRIRVGTSSSQVAFRVVKRFADGFATGAGTSAVVTPPVDATTAFPTQLPIAIGDTFGINCCLSSSRFEVSATGTTDVYLPVLVDGGPPTDTFINIPPNPYELAVNAEIEPTSVFSVTGVQRSKHGKLLVTANLPNPGTFAAGDRRATLLSAAAAKKKKKKPKLLKRSSVQVSAPTSTQLLVFPTKAAKVALSDGKKVKAGLKLAFTPTGGTTSTQLIKLKLRP